MNGLNEFPIAILKEKNISEGVVYKRWTLFR